MKEECSRGEHFVYTITLGASKFVIDKVGAHGQNPLQPYDYAISFAELIHFFFALFSRSFKAQLMSILSWHCVTPFDDR